MAKKQVVAIDIGTDTAKMVQLEQSSTDVRLINANVVTRMDTDDRYQMAEAMEQLWAPLGQPPTQGRLRALLNRNKTEIVLSLPRALVSTKRLTNLPAATDDQLVSIVAIAAEDGTPFSDRRSHFYLPRRASNIRCDFRRVNIYPSFVGYRLSRSS